MADGSTTLLFRFLGIDAGAGAEFDRMAGKTTMLGRSSAGALGLVKNLGIGVAIAGATIGVAAVKMAGDFQASMLRIHTQAHGSMQQVAALSKGVLDMAGAVASTPSTLADAAYHIASIGQKSLSTAQQLRVLRISTEGAKLGGADLVDVTNALDAAIVSHIPGVKNYSQAMGVLNSTVGAGDMQMQDLADAFGPLGAVMKGFNVNIKQVGAALAVFGDNNLRGAKAGTNLRMAIQALADPVKAGQEQLVSWGIKAGNLGKQLEHGGLTDALDTLAKKMKENGVTSKTMGETITNMFGKRAGIGLMVLEQELGRFHTKLGEVSKGATSFAGDWKDYTKSFQYAWDSAKASAEALMIQLGTALLPVATKVMNWISQTAIPALQHLGHWFANLSPQVKILAGVLLAVGAAFAFPVTTAIALGVALVVLYNKNKTFKTIVLDVAHAVVAAWNFMRSVGTTVFAAIGKVWTAFVNGPVAYVRDRIKDFTNWYDQHAQEIKTVTKVVWTIISTIIKTQIRIIMDFARPALQGLKTTFQVVFTTIKAIVTTAVHVIGDLFRTMQRTWQDTIGIILDLITGHWGKAWDEAKQLVSDAFSGIYHIFSDFARGALGLLYDAGRQIIAGLINGIKSMAGAAFNAVKDTIGGLVSGAKSLLGIHSPSKVFYQFGIWIVEGLVKGVKTYAVKAKSVARELALGFISSWSNGTSSLKSALVSPVQSVLERLTKVVDNEISKQDNILKRSRSALASLLKSRATDIANLAGSIGSAADLGGLFGTDINGNPTTANINQFLGQQATQIENFAKDLKWAARHGLSGVLLGEIANLGAVQGDAVLQQFKNGQAAIGAANRAETAIQKYSTQAAAAAEDVIYAKRVAKDRKAVEENSKRLRELTVALHNIERQTAKAASVHLTIDAKTGRPVVDKRFIDDIIKGIRRAERTAGKKLL